MRINWEVVIWTCVTLAVIMGVIALILAIVSARNLRKKREDLGEVHTTLSVGSRIMFAGGIYGKVVGFENDETVNVEIAKGTVITISRYAIQSIEK
ncbi:MAG: preprotein translocase subunit YajC [Clostridiaceae bacterium]|nr:preprotein translocase subunit YajC [Clostridiaceae bacterium]